MKAFYKVSVTKIPEGAAIVHKEPPLLGDVIIKVSDSNTAGDFKIIVVECSEEQHEMNLAYPGVTMLEEAEAVKLAPKYQPKRVVVELNERTRKEEKVELPAVNLQGLLKSRSRDGAKDEVGTKNPPPKKKVIRKKTASKPAR